MVNDEAEDLNKVWKKFLRKHWKMTAFFVLAAILAIIGMLYVFLWFVEDAQATDIVPTMLNLWTIGHIVNFLLNLIFWEIIFIGIPVIITVVLIYLLWWKRLPELEREEYQEGHLFGKHSRKTDGGGAISLLINIFFIIKVHLDGNWDVPIADWDFDYLVHSYLWAIAWILIIFGIPIAIGATLWLRYELKKAPE